MIEPIDSGDILTQEMDSHDYAITPRVQLFIDDMGKALCYTDNCSYRMDSCKHSRLAVDLMKAVIDYHANLLELKNQKTAASILRSEM